MNGLNGLNGSGLNENQIFLVIAISVLTSLSIMFLCSTVYYFILSKNHSVYNKMIDNQLWNKINN